MRPELSTLPWRMSASPLTENDHLESNRQRRTGAIRQIPDNVQRERFYGPQKRSDRRYVRGRNMGIRLGQFRRSNMCFCDRYWVAGVGRPAEGLSALNLLHAQTWFCNVINNCIAQSLRVTNNSTSNKGFEFD